jgi:hypothetical protein
MGTRKIRISRWRCGVLKEEVKLGRPSIVATLLWAFGIFIMGLTVYSLIFWEGGLTTIDLHDSLLIFVAFSRTLIDMHTIRYRIRRKIHE